MFKNENDFKKIVSQLNIDNKPNDAHHQNLRRQMLSVFSKGQQPKTTWQSIIKSPITKLAAAAAIIIAASLSITILDKSVTPAYAIEQTIEASHDVRYLHFEYLGSSRDRIMKEAWLEYDNSGQIKNVRVNFYNWGGRDIVMVWKEGKTEHWLKDKKKLKFFEDEIFTTKIIHFVQSYDPTRAVENIHKLHEKGDVEIEIEEPTNRTDPIVITAIYAPNTYLVEGPMPEMREIFSVDQTTKLVTAIEIYELKEGEYVDRGIWRYPDYDKPFDTGIFSLRDEVPEDVKRIDMMALDIGLEQTDLTKEEIAVKVVREFLEALIAKDYAKAVKISGYENLDQKAEMLKNLEKLNVVRIISIGEPFPPPPDKSRGSLGVPCTIEIEKNGEIIQRKLDNIFVYRVLGHPNRWVLAGF
ncbi:MAG: hypothetical protein ACYS8Y_11385 [Planctomycetota bacterium]|jgi:hypothetical protein